MPLFMMFAEPNWRARVFSLLRSDNTKAIREATKRAFQGHSMSLLSRRKVFNLVPKFIDSGNVQE